MTWLLLKPCPYCGNGPLVFIACPSCGAVLAWCGEEDHAVGRFDGTLLRDIGTGTIARRKTDLDMPLSPAHNRYSCFHRNPAGRPRMERLCPP